MNFQQLSIIRETIRCRFNLTEVAASLATAQSGISKHIRDLEHELGVELFIRKGKRLTGLTEPGRAIIPHIENALLALDNIRSATDQLAQEQVGTLRIATTHTQARFILPTIIKQFRPSFPSVRLSLLQTSPSDICAMLRDNRIDIGIATEEIGTQEDIIAYPFYRWKHLVLAPAAHELGDHATLHDVARYPLITYLHGFTGRTIIDRTFSHAGLRPNVVMEAIDADVIKDYVRLGMGIGIVAEMAADHSDKNLRIVTVTPEFQEMTTFIAIRRDRFLRNFVFHFIAACRPDFAASEFRDAAQQLQNWQSKSSDVPTYQELIKIQKQFSTIT